MNDNLIPASEDEQEYVCLGCDDPDCPTCYSQLLPDDFNLDVDDERYD